ncbi:MAG: hypothetical protein A3K30_00555 [Deltaproteobacteria bacterium RBG_13_51_10]|nr:MAG: hypothetical protein A3K30_00555 [Deltaproteobacteria bacterium RBG_13_51_10]
MRTKDPKTRQHLGQRGYPAFKRCKLMMDFWAGVHLFPRGATRRTLRNILGVFAGRKFWLGSVFFFFNGLFKTVRGQFHECMDTRHRLQSFWPPDF